MPLKKSKSKSAFKSNIRAEVQAGKPVKQALAVASRDAWGEAKAVMKLEGDWSYRNGMVFPVEPLRPSDDEAIGRMCRYLKKHGLVGQTTLAGRLTLTPKDEAVTAMLFGAPDGQRPQGPRRTKTSL